MEGGMTNRLECGDTRNEKNSLVDENFVWSRVGFFLSREDLHIFFLSSGSGMWDGGCSV